MVRHFKPATARRSGVEKENAVSDPAIASEDGTEQLTAAERNGAAALNGNGSVDISQETVLRPVPHPTPERSPLRRWTDELSQA